MTYPVLARPHLEALLVARVLLDPELADHVDDTRLSPAAQQLVDFAADENTAARVTLWLGVTDEFQARLAKRVDALTLEELRYHPTATLVALINQLPQLGVTSARPRSHAA